MTAPFPKKGDIVGKRFETDRLLGSGATGYVFQAKDRAKRKSEDVALKMFLPGQAPPGILDCVKQEIAADLNSPFIAQSMGGFQENGNTYVIMKLVRGQSLFDLLITGPISLPTTVHVGCCLCSAIEELTRKSLVSTDIKPANAIIEEGTGNCVLIDLSTHEECNQRPRISGGTLPYAAPELLRKETLSETTDIFSLSVMLGEVATGTSPIQGATEQTMESNILAGNADLSEVKALNKKLAKLLQAGMDGSPKERPTASEFRRELEVIVGVRAAKACLHFAGSQGQQRVVEITGDGLSLGRSLDTGNLFVSEVHARLTRENDEFLLEDSGSKNGVWMDGQRVQRASLKLGDSFSLANLRFTLLAG